MEQDFPLRREREGGSSRGFTGHEWLPWFNLYNMNGRLYDPLVGRFLSPDNNVQMPDYTQNFNRYSYALNNPLKYTDPDGENPLLAFIIGAIAGAYLGGTATNDWNWNPGKWDYQNPATYFGIVGGGLAGGLGAQWMFGPGGVMAGGTPLNVSLGASFSNASTAFANFSIGGGGGFTLQTLGYATVAGGGLYATGSTIKNFFKNDFIFENEFRIDYGVQAEVQGKLFGSKIGFSGEKETEPLVQLNYGYNEGLYGYGYSFDNPSYGYNGIKDPYRTSISGGFVFAGGEVSYNPHRDLFKVGEKNSEEINAFLFNISKYYNSNGDILESQYYIGSGFDFSLFFGISYDFKIGFKRNNY